MHPNFRIRAGRPEDAGLIAVLASQVWLHTYATDGIDRDIADYVLSEFTPRRFLSMLAEPATQLLVAEHDSGLVGLAVVSFDRPCEAGGHASVELQTLYVQAHFIGRGIGQALLRAAEGRARERAGSALWLTVNARNAAAIGFYAHQGYAKIGTAYFVLGEGRHENHVLIGNIDDTSIAR